MLNWTRPAFRTNDERKDFLDLVALCGLPPHSYRVHSDDERTLVEVDLDDPAARSRAEEALARAYERAVMERPDGPAVLLDLLDAPAPGRGSADGEFIAIRPGLWAGHAPVAELLRRLDALFLRTAREQGAEEYAVPHLIPWDSLRRAGYVAAFPQHLTACYSVRPDLDAVEQLGEADTPAAAEEILEPQGLCLSPAACYHVYPLFAGTSVDPGLLITAMAHCSRRELAWTPLPIRFHSFRMRELIFIGSREHTLAFRDRQLEMCQDLMRAIGLPSRIVSATDPFFTSSRDVRLHLQNSLDLKHEIVARDAQGNDFAIGSANFHFDHIGRAFDLTADGKPAQSSCMAFGLDRWAHWILSHCGANPADWPKPLRAPSRKSDLNAIMAD
ncbi:hypothetical protein OIE66_17210 [Nonomuraea sp. NBC_01738]|uniref:hypothetical protein n=1 Tax=Nonomuraea sp. NBC_01738 TaxID=2976003 RepID=UPI002E0D4A27|nr:hypothetical protein OIE66_17210 [Nonomuraea sp. NBC_01738]